MLFTIGQSATKGYLSTPEGGILRNWPITLCVRVQRSLCTDKIVYTIRDPGFPSHRHNDHLMSLLRVGPSMVPNLRLEGEVERGELPRRSTGANDPIFFAPLRQGLPPEISERLQ